MARADRSSIPQCPIKLVYRSSAEIMFILGESLNNNAVARIIQTNEIK